MPDYPNKKVADTVTIHHLLTHTSGMGDYLSEKFDQTSRAKFHEIRDFLPLFVDEPLRFEPGTGWDYSNSGYMLLGAIIEIARKVALPPPSLKGNTTFKLKKCLGAKTVELVGSFDDWKRAQLLFGREGHQWVIRVDLSPGRYTYRFVVNGQPTTDPFNPVTEVDEKGIARSVLIVE